MSTSSPRVVEVRPEVECELTAAAFGARPGMHPLPVSGFPRERWMRAVALGGQGRYSQARTELTVLTTSAAADAAVVSLAWSTQASLLRQLGRHDVASGFDGRALAVVGAGAGHVGGERDVLLHEARCDALTGLAADALGCGRLALGWQLLERCDRYLGDLDASPLLWRQNVRKNWVSAELALAGADFTTARRHAEAATALAEASGSVRHHVKSELLRCASMTGDRDLTPAVRLARDVLDRCEGHGLVPLKWAAAMLLAGVTADPENVLGK
ncbi:MAG: hypothetical protein WAW17_08070 [Rhodococcus sp. (in: high G+C Gram-positive bacteria)]|uniref:hypothetical protein n=1 Tax=Rhodococcus sp. TaxID=1831 RepID=UPI003BAEA81D